MHTACKPNYRTYQCESPRLWSCTEIARAKIGGARNHRCRLFYRHRHSGYRSYRICGFLGRGRSGHRLWSAKDIRKSHRRDHFVDGPIDQRSEEHTSELQSLMRTSYAVFCLKKKKEET